MKLKVPQKSKSKMSDNCCEISCRERCPKTKPGNNDLDIRSYIGWATGHDNSILDGIWIK